MKVFTGRFFEDFTIGQRLLHAVPRTLHGGDIALYMALTGERGPLASSTEVARSLGFVRWGVVPKRDKPAIGGANGVPQLPAVVTADRLPVPDALNLQRFPDLTWAFGGDARWDDYEVGERLDHPDAMTIEEADHMQA